MNSKELFFTIFILAYTQIDAQTCCSGWIPLSNNISLPLSEKGTIQIGLNYDYTI
ncbi:hypothetical protein [Flavivirga jejuensis]|uniref:Uncharacterized protein n=1 Tax=Flavivirga jejuensis TaxID=870487 RepID=A0ABT8WNF0_9FLAO|nr:hypothetical protein [Flavivirga jejuensis]MDO5974688.1 hypothetical protein [Flavivirga jejuensis]